MRKLTGIFIIAVNENGAAERRPFVDRKGKIKSQAVRRKL